MTWQAIIFLGRQMYAGMASSPKWRNSQFYIKKLAEFFNQLYYSYWGEHFHV